MAWYPLVGCVTGLVTGYGYALAKLFFSSGVSAALTLILYIVFTRALHLDGFMDTIDGFFSHRPKEQILKIMKDPQVGSFAALGAGGWFLVLYSAIPQLSPLDHVLIHTFSRTCILLLPLIFPYPRQSGTGKFFVENVNGKTFLLAVVLAFAVALGGYYAHVLGSGYFKDIILFSVYYLAAMAVSFLIALLAGSWANRKIEGITGDVLGFVIELNHMAIALVLIIYLPL